MLTYGELNKVGAGWVTSHVISDILSNAQVEFGKSYRDEEVSNYNLDQITEKAKHFNEPIPPQVYNEVQSRCEKLAELEYLRGV